MSGEFETLKTVKRYLFVIAPRFAFSLDPRTVGNRVHGTQGTGHGGVCLFICTIRLCRPKHDAKQLSPAGAHRIARGTQRKGDGYVQLGFSNLIRHHPHRRSFVSHTSLSCFERLHLSANPDHSRRTAVRNLPQYNDGQLHPGPRGRPPKHRPPKHRIRVIKQFARRKAEGAAGISEPLSLLRPSSLLDQASSERPSWS